MANGIFKYCSVDLVKVTLWCFGMASWPKQ